MGVGKNCQSHNSSDKDSKALMQTLQVQSEKVNKDYYLEEHFADMPRLFSFSLELKSLKLNHKPTRGVWQISLYHEQANMPRSFRNIDVQENDCIDEDSIINFRNNLELKLYFTSYKSNIMEMIKSSNVCTLCIKGPHNIHAKAQLDCKALLGNDKDKTTGNILLTNQNESVVALAQILIHLEDSGLNFNAKPSTIDSQQFHDGFNSHNFGKLTFFILLFNFLF